MAEVATPSADDVRFVQQLLDVDVDRRLVLVELQRRGVPEPDARGVLDFALRQRNAGV